MPLSALVFYLRSKHVYEARNDAYLFSALRAILMKKPDSYYKEYPAWNDPVNANKSTPKTARRVMRDTHTPKEIMMAEFAKAKGR